MFLVIFRLFPLSFWRDRPKNARCTISERALSGAIEMNLLEEVLEK